MNVGTSSFPRALGPNVLKTTCGHFEGRLGSCHVALIILAAETEANVQELSGRLVQIELVEPRPRSPMPAKCPAEWDRRSTKTSADFCRWAGASLALACAFSPEISPRR